MEEPEKIVSQTELDDKAQKLVEEKDADSRLRVYVGPMEKALTAVLLIWAVFQVWANMFGTLGAVKLRTAHIMFLLPLAFTLYPTFKKERRRRRLMPVWDIALIAAAILSYGYLFMRYDAIARTGRLNSTDVWVGVVCLVVAFEAARRASGNLAIIALIFLSYFAVWGRYIPGTFGTSAFTLKRVIKALVWDTNGVLGTGAGVSATYIFVFVLFGAFLKYSGFSQFINDIALTLVGQTPGGPAKVAVIASALMGMINGSAIANVATTGTITIPLMKKTGYKKDFAAAVEAVASTGGQFTPPIMGAVGFVMAEFMCVSYTKVMLAAAIPAFLYYLSLLYSVHLEAKRLGLSGLSKENIPQAGKVLRERGHLLIPLVVLLALMFTGYTPLFGRDYRDFRDHSRVVGPEGNAHGSGNHRAGDRGGQPQRHRRGYQLHHHRRNHRLGQHDQPWPELRQPDSARGRRRPSVPRRPDGDDHVHHPRHGRAGRGGVCHRVRRGRARAARCGRDGDGGEHVLSDLCLPVQHHPARRDEQLCRRGHRGQQHDQNLADRDEAGHCGFHSAVLLPQ